MLRFGGNGVQKQFTRNPHHFSMQNSHEISKKKSSKVFWRAGHATIIRPSGQRLELGAIAETRGAGNAGGIAAETALALRSRETALFLAVSAAVP